MIIEEYDESLFISRFEDYKRIVTEENKNGNFSYKGLRFLFEYLEEITTEETPYKLDVIALCCEFSEYKDLKEYCENYKTENSENYLKFLEKYKTAKEDELIVLKIIKDDLLQQIEQEINEKTTLIKFDDDLDEGFIIGQY